jgi:hypothetical protein
VDSITFVEALTVGFAALVATTSAEVADFDAVNNPLLEMLPPVADHATSTFVVPRNVAVNWTVPPALICGFKGEIATLTLPCEELEPWLEVDDAGAADTEEHDDQMNENEIRISADIH